MSDKFYVGLDLTGFENNGIQRPVSRVTLKVDEERVLTAGNDTGLELTADCPHATQDTVNSLLKQLRGFEYKMYSASDVNIDPAMELGDGITASGLYSVIARIADDGSGFPSASAPGQAELEDEYPSSGPMTKAFDRKIAETRSRITKTAEEIRLEVERVNGRVVELSTSFSVELGKITGKIQDLNGNFSKMEQTISGISATVTDVQKGLSQTVRLSADGVTITNAKGSKLTIDGGQIKASTLNLTGCLTFNDFDASAKQQLDGISQDAALAMAKAESASESASNAVGTLQGWTYGGTTYIDGSKIYTGTLTASKLQGGSIGILSSSGSVSATMTPAFEDSGIYNSLLISSGWTRITATNGPLELYTTNLYQGVTYSAGLSFWPNSDRWNQSIYVSGNLFPMYWNESGTANQYNLGGSGSTLARRWNNIYLQNSPNVLSDLRLKENVSYGLDRYDAFFDELRPISYTMQGKTDGPRRTGLGAQEVEAALKAAELTAADFAGLTVPEDSDGYYSLHYEEFIALCIDQVQRLKKRVAQLERSIQ